MKEQLLRLVRSSLLGAGIWMGGAMMAPKAEAQIPVTDVAHIACNTSGWIEEMIQWGYNLVEWYKNLKQLYETYVMINAAYQGVKSGDWGAMGWVEVLNLSQLPYFDGIEGIDDVRDLCGLTEMGVGELENIFYTLKSFERLVGDPDYAARAGNMERLRIMRKLNQRMNRRKVAMARATQKYNKENDGLKKAQAIIQAKLEGYSSQDPAPLGAIMGCQAKLQQIQNKMADNAQRLEMQFKTIGEQEKAEFVQVGDEITEEYLKVMREKKADGIKKIAEGYTK